jgi:hypothetical protein
MWHSRIELDFILIIKHSKDLFSFDLKAPPRNEDAWRDLPQFTCKPLVIKGKGLPYFMLGNACSCGTPLILVPMYPCYCPGVSDPKIRGGPQELAFPCTKRHGWHVSVYKARAETRFWLQWNEVLIPHSNCSVSSPRW